VTLRKTKKLVEEDLRTKTHAAKPAGLKKANGEEKPILPSNIALVLLTGSDQYLKSLLLIKNFSFINNEHVFEVFRHFKPF
jgi:hypothetical protein